MTQAYLWDYDSETVLRRLADQVPVLTRDEEARLARDAIAGDSQAEDRLVASHLRVVIAVARRYARAGIPIGDLVQEGTIGLLKAVRKFDPTRDIRLSTYATWWIRAAIQDHVMKSWSLVRLGKSSAHRSLFFAIRRKAAELKRNAVDLGDGVLDHLATRFGVPLVDAQIMARRLSFPDQSLVDDGFVSGDGVSSGTFVSQDPTPEEIVADRAGRRRRRDLIIDALARLPDREARIIRGRHLSEIKLTLEALGRELGVSKARVRQLEKQALKRLGTLLAGLRHVEDAT